jgi:hypothetical protein
LHFRLLMIRIIEVLLTEDAVLWGFNVRR